MSVINCHDCGRSFNTDEDPDFLVDIGNMRRMTWTVPMCEPCREDRLDEIEREVDAADRACAEAERRAP